jgi:HAD superfamily hydrolase (TIGR01490 family)
VSENANKLAIFDVDKTLAHCNVSFAFGKYLYKKKFFSFFKMLALVFSYALHLIKLMPLKALHHISFYFLFYKASKAEVERLAQEFIDLEANNLIRKELELKLFQLKAENQIVWLQSSSPDFIIQPLAKKLSADEFFATKYESDKSGRFTKILKIVDGHEKLNILEKYLSDSGISAENVTFYSDSMLDLPLLSRVGTPIAVFPEHRLKEIAIKNSWSIIE